MNKILLRSMYALSIITLITSCKPDENIDETPPLISLVSPADDASFISGDTIFFEAEFSDNIALQQYKLEIHENFDGHGHGKNTQPFFYSHIGNLSGTFQQVNLVIPIPENVMAGPYDVLVFATDASGNEADFVEHEIHILNKNDQIAPEIAITSLNVNSLNTIQKGQSITIIGTVSDNQALKEIEILLYNSSNQKVYDEDIDVAGQTSYSLNHHIDTSSLTEGNYVLEIIAIDHVNNRTKIEFEILIE